MNCITGQVLQLHFLNLLNKENRGFIVEDIPDLYKNQLADNTVKSRKYIQADCNARRIPKLLTRDHVARSIVGELSEGGLSPYKAVYLDMSLEILQDIDKVQAFPK